MKRELYETTLHVKRDPFNDLYECAELILHENIARELGWIAGDELYCSVRMGERGNVLVIERAKELDIA